jgi:hypothetical protein
VITVALALSLILGSSTPQQGTAPSTLNVQKAKVDITPDELLPLGGYTARHDKDMAPGGEHLYARCIVFSYGNWKEALVSAEMLTIPDSLAEEVKKRLPADVSLFLCATHTHSAPDSQLLNSNMTFKIPGVASFRHRWLTWYADKISSAVTAALTGARRPYTKLEVGEFNADLNRGRRPGADPEHLGTVLKGLFLSYPAHPVIYGPDHNQTSGDWPGRISAEKEKSAGVFLVLAGAIGDVSPKAEGATDEARVTSFCAALMSEKPHFYKEWKLGKPISSLEEPIVMESPVPSPAFIQDYKVPPALAQSMVARFAPNHASISVVRLGDFVVVGVPGEPTSHLGRRIRAAGLKMGYRSVLVVSHVNGWIGYILDPVDYSHGGYEASLSFNGPMEGEHVVEASIKAMKALR